jgi:hypothetical protein
MKSTSEILKGLSDAGKDELTVDEIIKESGSRAHGFGLLIFALPEALPLPLPSVALVLAIPLILLSGHLIIFGEGAGIPKRVRRQTLRTSLIRKVAKYCIPVFEKLEHLSRPRFLMLVRRERLLGVACLLLSVVLFLPIPLANFLPAVCLVAVAFGMLQRDGIIVAAGLIGFGALIAALVVLTNFAGYLG